MCNAFLFFPLETVFTHHIYFYFLFKKNSLRPLSGCSYPLAVHQASAALPARFQGELLTRPQGTRAPADQSATPG